MGDCMSIDYRESAIHSAKWAMERWPGRTIIVRRPVDVGEQWWFMNSSYKDYAIAKTAVVGDEVVLFGRVGYVTDVIEVGGI